MAEVTIQKKTDTITSYQNSLLNRAESMSSFLNRVIFRMYQDAQRRRWISEGESEKSSTQDLSWPDLTETYAQWKKRKYQSYPGGGDKMMVATNTLQQSVIDSAYKIVENTSITISANPGMTNPESNQTISEYAKYVAGKRPFMIFGDDTIRSMKEAVRHYIKSGTE